MSKPDDREVKVTPEEEAFYIDVAKKYIELDLGIKRWIDKTKPVNGPQPDAGVHDDMIQAARLVLIKNHGKIVKSGMSRSYCRSLLQIIPADHSYRSSGWKLSEHDSKELHKAREEAHAEAPLADAETQKLLARKYYIEGGGDPLVFDTICGEPLSLFRGDAYEDEHYYDYLDLLPDPALGPEELVVEGDEPSPIQRTIDQYMAEKMDEADLEFVETLTLFKRLGLEQRDAAEALRMKEWEVTRRKKKIAAEFQSWKATEAQEPDEDSLTESG